jgi:cobalt-zinc-cadmium efflux system outer membrane protein
VGQEIRERTGQDLGPGSEPGERSIPAGVNPADGVSEDEAVAIALWNNAAFQEAIATLGYQRSDLVQAGLLPNPVFSILFPIGPKQLEFTAKFPLEFLVLRHQRMRIAELECEKAAEALVQCGLDLIRDVKLDWAALSLARDRLRFGVESERIRAQIAEIAEARLRAGDSSELETNAARIDAIRAREDIVRSEHQVALAEGRLKARLGLLLVPPERDLEIAFAEAVEPPACDWDSASLMRGALAARPDLRAAELDMEEAGKRVGLAWWEILAVTGLVDANAKGKEGFEIGPGLEVTVPIFNQQGGKVARAETDVEVAARRYVTVRDRILLEVSEAHGTFLQAVQEIEGLRARVIPPLDEALRRCEKAYEAGEVSYLFVLGAAKDLEDCRLREREVLAAFRRARADLERAVGRVLEPEPPLDGRSGELEESLEAGAVPWEANPVTPAGTGGTSAPAVQETRKP